MSYTQANKDVPCKSATIGKCVLRVRETNRVKKDTDTLKANVKFIGSAQSHTQVCIFDPAASSTVISEEIYKKLKWKGYPQNVAFAGFEGTIACSRVCVRLTAEVKSLNKVEYFTGNVTRMKIEETIIGIDLIKLLETDIKCRDAGYSIAFSKGNKSVRADGDDRCVLTIREVTEDEDAAMDIISHIKSTEVLDSDAAKAMIRNIRSEDLKERPVALIANLIQGIDIRLEDEKRARIIEFLKKNRNVFSTSFKDLGKLDYHLCPMDIKVDQKDVPYCHPYRMSEQRRNACIEMMKQLEDADIIQKSNAQGGVPAMLIPKKNGDHRFVVDYTKLNKLIQKSEYPMPVIDDFLNVLKGNEYFTVVDLTIGYYQLELAPEVRAKTVFVTEDGKYEFKRLPKGLNDAPYVFQCLMN